MIKVTNLNKYFYHRKANEIHVINDVTLEFPKTGLVTIIGESGSGKTTLLNVIGGLDNFYKGSIEIDGLEIKKYSSRLMDRIRNEKIGYIFQNYLLLQQRTVYENLKIVLNMYNITDEEKNSRIDYVLKAVGMMKYKKKNVSQLSGGQQQRVAIARALIKSPALILADEPTGNLDEKNTIQIMNIIKKISKHTLVILVSHEKNIAYSYSDYLIEVCDGKVLSNKSFDSVKYQYEDDQTLYLKEYQYQNISNENVNIDFYSNENKKINLKIVYNKGKFYIEGSDDVVYLDKTSEIIMKNESRKILDADVEYLENDFELSKLKYSKTPSLTFKETTNLAFSNLKQLKKRTFILMIPLILIVVLMLLCIQSIIGASKVDYQHIAYSDSRIYNIYLEKGDAQTGVEASKFGFEKFYQEFVEGNPNIEPIITTSTTFYYTLPDFNQIQNQKYKLNGFSLLSDEFLKESDLIYGRMPKNASEIVVDKWVLENLLTSTTLYHFMSVETFLNKELFFDGRDYGFKIVGISSNNQNTIYLNKWSLFDFFPSNLRKKGLTICSLSEFKKYQPEYQDLELDKYQAAAHLSRKNITYNNEIYLNESSRLRVDVVDYLSYDKCPYQVIVSDEIYDDLLKIILSTEYKKLDVFCENEAERQQVNNFVDKVKDFYGSGELQATEEFGYTLNQPIDYKTIRLLVSADSKYDNIVNPYILESQRVVTSRVLVTITIIIISIVIVFFSMKSYAIKNIYDIGVYRAIGIKKRSIVFVYALQVFIISLRTTFLFGTLCYVITNILSNVPIINSTISISLGLYLITTFGLMTLNIIVGIIPVMMYLRLTPSQLLTKYDV